MKKALDVKAKGWSKEDISKLRGKVKRQGVKHEVTIKLKDGTIKWLYVKDPADVKSYCEQVGATIVKIEDFN